MAESHVISALAKKRSELRGDIIHYKELARLADQQLATINQTIRIFEPDYKFGSTKPVNRHKNRYFDTGEAKVLLLDTLRLSDCPMRTDDIAQSVADKKGIVFEDDFQKSTFQKTVVASLDRIEKSGLIERGGRDGVTMIWQIKAKN